MTILKQNIKTDTKKIVLICPEHGEFTIIANNHLLGSGCRRCKRKIENVVTNPTPTYNTETFIAKTKNIHGDKYDYSKVQYVNKRTKIKIICPLHGEFEQIPDDHINKPSGCPKCGHKVYTQEQFINTCKQIHNNKYDYSKTVYTGVRNKIIIICPEHGEFEQTAHSHLAGGGCPQCRLKQQTKLFNMICHEFPDENILFEVNKDVVSWIGQQRLDIYFPMYNIAIEYDGIQHSQPVEIFGGEERFHQQQLLDQNKNTLCTENKCHLFRVPYNYTEEYFIEVCLQIRNIIKEQKTYDTTRCFKFKSFR